MTRCHCRIEYRGRAYDSWQALADDYGLSVFCARSVPLTVKGASWWQELWKLI